MPLLSRVWGLATGRRGLAVEAVVYLILARVALRFIPFCRLTGFFARPPAQPEVTGAARERLRQEVCWAINAATRHLPGRTVCFPRAIAAQAMLRRRGVATTLYYGAATQSGRRLTTHVWVQDGAEGVVGHLVAQGFHVLARYPESR